MDATACAVTLPQVREQSAKFDIIHALRAVSAMTARGLACLGGIAALLLLLLVCINATGRLLGMPIRGAVESSGVLGALVGTLALGFAQIHGNHITGGVAVNRLPAALRYILNLLSLLCGCVFFLFAAYEVADLGLFSLECGETIDGLGALYPYLILLTVPGFLGQAVILGCSLLISVLTGREE